MENFIQVTTYKGGNTVAIFVDKIVAVENLTAEPSIDPAKCTIYTADGKDYTVGKSYADIMNAIINASQEEPVLVPQQKGLV